MPTVYPVRQRTPYDCSVCAIAMARGVRYEEAMEAALLAEDFDPKSGMWGMGQRTLKLLDGPDFSALRRDWCMSHAAFRRYAWRRRALLAVPSLNRQHGFHMVYYDGDRLHDPAVGHLNRSFDDLMPDEMVIFDEHRP